MSTLTKREAFALAAMHAMLSRPTAELQRDAREEGAPSTGQYIRDQAYAMADLMLNQESRSV